MTRKKKGSRKSSPRRPGSQKESDRENQELGVPGRLSSSGYSLDLNGSKTALKRGSKGNNNKGRSRTNSKASEMLESATQDVLMYQPDLNGPTTELKRRGKGNNNKGRSRANSRASDMLESATQDVPGYQPNYRQHSFPNHSSTTVGSSGGFFEGASGVEISGGSFNQIYGHQTNVTVHVNLPLEEHHSLRQHPSKQFSTPPSQARRSSISGSTLQANEQIDHATRFLPATAHEQDDKVIPNHSDIAGHVLAANHIRVADGVVFLEQKDVRTPLINLAPLPRRPTLRPRRGSDSSPVLFPKDTLIHRQASLDSTSSGSPVVFPQHSMKPGIVASPAQHQYQQLQSSSPHNKAEKQSPGIHLRKGKWPDDFMDAFYAPSPTQPAGSSPDNDSAIVAPGTAVASASVTGPVPFPRSVSATSGENTWTSSPRTLSTDDKLLSDRSGLLRGRCQSDVEGSVRCKARSSSYDELGSRSPRSRFESMVNLGESLAQISASDVLARDLMDSSAIRDGSGFIVQEDGKPPTHFQLGNCIGKGKSSSVYRALNLNTGQIVAVKRIRLERLKEEEVTTLMKRFDLVKSLSHPNIIKYEGMAREDGMLNIVLEFAENGSLKQTIQAFGKFNEHLVASYVVKILEALHYLHMSDVVHCDLKAANILTTKHGNVKLSDFGMSLNLRAMERERDVTGIPNWMAPEVIELKGASTKSDIWSLGCTVIEMLTGRPPYAEITNAMTIMFRIVEDDIPPIPEDSSDLLKDFLEQCFHKDPIRRPSAEMLCEHAWLKNTWGTLKELRPQDSIPFLRRVTAELHKLEIVPYLTQQDIPVSPISGPYKRIEGGKAPTIARRTSGASLHPLDNDFAPGAHTFVKTTFHKPITCRVCQLTIKKTAVLCSQCSLISHAKCADNAPPTCGLRADSLSYTEKGNLASAYSNLSNEFGQPIEMSDTAALDSRTWPLKITSSSHSEALIEADRDNLGLFDSLPTNISTKKKFKVKDTSSANCLVQ